MSNDWIPKQLREVAGRIARGERPETTVRELLFWFGYKGRHKWAVGTVRQALKKLNLVTRPDFDWTYLDGPITFLDYSKASSNESPPGQTQSGERETPHVVDASDQTREASGMGFATDPTYRIGRLEIANRPPVGVAPDATITQAVTLMLKNDFSQLPVMTSEREVKGLFSWKSLGGRASQGLTCKVVREAMDGHCEVSADESLFRALPLIQEHDCILIRDSMKKITGIMTSYDISVTFKQLAEPFLVLSEIENHIRNLLRGKFTRDELASVRDPGDTGRTIDDVEDLTFGEYMRLLENPERWVKLCLRVDRCIFTKEIDEVRRIRNDVMHFDPEGTDESDLARLREFADFLRRLERLRPK